MSVPKKLAAQGSKEAAVEYLSVRLRKLYRVDVLPKEATDAVEAIVADIEFPAPVTEDVKVETVEAVEKVEKSTTNVFKRNKNNPVFVEQEPVPTVDVQPETDTQNN